VGPARLLLRKEFEPDHGQLEFGEVDGAYPQWASGSEPFVANAQKIVVATLPEMEGSAVLEVWESEDDEAPEEGTILIYDGIIQLSGSNAEIGTGLGGNLVRVPLERGEHRVRVFVDEPGYAARVVFLVSTAEPRGSDG
jgi:hypothetical protein